MQRQLCRSTRRVLTASVLGVPKPAPGLTAFNAFRRGYSSTGSSEGSGSGSGSDETPKHNPLPWAVGAFALGGGFGYWLYNSASTRKIDEKGSVTVVSSKPKSPSIDYSAVYKAIANVLEEADYDDGSYGPVFVRLAWHASGTYDKNTKTGGSNGATMRFAPESEHGANAGLHHARARLEKVKQQFPEISYADLWTLAGVVAVQEMGGPIIPWRPGRTDVDPSVGTASCPPDGRLPDAAQGSSHVRDIFYRMGFNDREIAALIGAHALGRCHTDRSGYDGPWTPAPTYFTNDFYQRLLGEKWVERKWKGPRQFENASDKSLMMLPGDMAFRDDSDFKKYVEIYAKDEGKFFEDFSAAYVKLLELGVPFKPEAKPVEFAKLN